MRPVKDILQQLLNCHTLAYEEARECMMRIAGNELNEAQTAAFLTIFMMRPITVNELLGFRQAITELCVRVDLSAYEPLDVCGTGGDGRNTFNISTLTAFVAAGAGIKVAKHGNYGVSSVSGSSNVMEYFGYRFSDAESKLKKELEEAGICFLHAPLFHPALKAVAPVRKQLGVRTFFNMLGPLVNPCNPPVQVSGVFSFELQRIYNYILQREKERYTVLISTDGYDEISLTAPVKICTPAGEQLLSPEAMGFEKIVPDFLYGGKTIAEAANIFSDVLNNSCTEAQRQVVVANAAVAIHCYYPEKGYAESRAMAEESLLSGKAKKVFEKLLSMQP
ncbi:MAG: anthranilate phosphoribosyltransferase [Chitinophagales bacterium]|nr:MAG: anthranilate phosphoribosyltransferase [Chitinophagales bacterium]